VEQPESDHFLQPESSLHALAEECRDRWRKAPALRWVLGRQTSYRHALPPADHDGWWDALEAAAGALALLSNRRVWTDHDVRAAQGFVKWGKRRHGWKGCLSKHGCDATNPRAVRWTALGAMERASDDPDGLGVVLALEVARRAACGRPLALVEEQEGYRGIMRVLRRVVERLWKVVEGCGSRRRRKRRRRGRRSETRVSDSGTCPGTERCRRSAAAA
jgi:hypothetical protein